MKHKKIIAIFLSYNASKTLTSFYDNFPKELFDEIILVDDASVDNSYQLARKLGITSYLNPHNLGYGGNMKHALDLALEKNADIIVDIHPDNEYLPSVIPLALQRMVHEDLEFILGNRFNTLINPLKSGMYIWKLFPIILLNRLDRIILNLKIDDLHQGFRVYSKSMLDKINYHTNSNNYLFSFELIAQAAFKNIRLGQVPVEVNYRGKKRGASMKNSIIYSIGTFKVLALFLLARMGIKTKLFK